VTFHSIFTCGSECHIHWPLNKPSPVVRLVAAQKMSGVNWTKCFGVQPTKSSRFCDAHRIHRPLWSTVFKQSVIPLHYLRLMVNLFFYQCQREESEEVSNDLAPQDAEALLAVRAQKLILSLLTHSPSAFSFLEERLEKQFMISVWFARMPKGCSLNARVKGFHPQA